MIAVRGLAHRELMAMTALIGAGREPVLAQLYNVPQTDQDWDRWSFSNHDALAQIVGAVAAQKNISLATYQVWPIDFDDIDNFLDANQQAHSDFNAALGLNGNDLLHVDLRDPNQRQSWVWLNAMEVQSACQVLKIGP